MSRPRVFVSYSRKDMAFVDRLDEALEAHGIEALVDRADIYAFEDWWKRVEALIAQADSVIFVLSPDAVGSEVCGKEISFAQGLHKRLAPIVFRPVADVPEALARLNFIFFDDETRFAENTERLAQALKTNIDWIRQHTEFGAAARHWSPDGRPGPPGLLLRSPVLEEAERWIASRPAGAPMPTETTRKFIAESRRAATRRRNTLTASLAAGLLVALALAGLAYWERGKAVEQRGIARSEAGRAERNFDAAKSTLDAVIFDLVEGLENIEGMRTDTVRRILARAEAAVGQLASKTDDNVEVRRSQGVMFRLFSDTYRRLGALDLAADYARKALDLRRDLVARDPANVQWRIDLSVSLERMGEVLMAQGDGDGAVSAFREALDITRALSVSEPGNLALRRAVWVDLNKLTDALVAQGKRDGALAAYREGLGLARELSASDPENANWRRDISVSLNKVGDMLVAQGDGDGALQAFREALDIRRALSAKDPDNTEWRRDVLVDLQKIGDVLWAKQDRAGAIAAFREGVEIAREVARMDPEDAERQINLVSMLDRLALFQDQPRERWSEALSILKRLDAKGLLRPFQAKWIAVIEARLAGVLQPQ